MIATSAIHTLLFLLNLPLYEYGKYTPNNEFIQDFIPIFARQVTHCLESIATGSSGFGDSLLGKFSPIQANCSFPRCPPEKPKDINTQFLLSSGSRELLIDAKQIISKSSTSSSLVSLAKKFTTSSDVLVLVHGWMESYHYTREFNKTISAFIKMGFDVIFVEWSGGNKELYVATSNSLVVAAQTGYLIKALGIAGKTYCVGFSIGANICGLTSQWLKVNGQRQLPFCTGIDPSGVFVEDCPGSLRLSSDDCDVVTAIHSSYLGSSSGYGTSIKQGHCDYWIDFREDNPGCPNPDLFDLRQSFSSGYFNSNAFINFISQLVACNHLKGLKFFELQATSYPNIRLKFKECSGPEGSLDCRNANYSLESDSASYVHSMPPFDSCKAGDNKDFCLCLLDTLQ